MQTLKKEIKQKIIEVGKFRFKKDGFENTSMKDIASDAGISIGNIYRYFVTKNHILDEILSEIEIEIEETFNKLPSDYNKINMHEIFQTLSSLTIKIANENNDTLKVLFNSQNQSQFIDFKEKILGLFTQKMIAIASSIKNKKNYSDVLCEAVARAEFEGFTFIVKNDIDNINKLKSDLKIYEELMMKSLKEQVLEVIN